MYYGNLIANCGFENGVLSPWVHTTPSFQHSWAISTNSPYLGNYVATTGAIVVGDTLVTVVPTVPNAKYVVSFNFRNTGTPNQTWLTFGGVRILSLVDSNYPSWVVRTLESYTSLYLSIHLYIYPSIVTNSSFLYLLYEYTLYSYVTESLKRLLHPQRLFLWVITNHHGLTLTTLLSWRLWMIYIH